MKVYTLRYKTAWSEIMDLHDNFDEDETVIIECMEVTSEETSLERLNNIRKHYAEKKNK